ncbi:MAG: tRNA (adenosine(37)-N6)-threonylcarbamoyltransferase complex ATPase subunit type 1 TsaE [Bacteroidetes bacterium B1(2017)]|nr:MAG: tRNA (adenosine(37)-N6)-threonylcarbamoyltransferase complex ATPase subunit type 1 TsaE [Bacteroidetes bacterium B1(2017)]
MPNASSFRYSLNQLNLAAAWVIQAANTHKIWCFDGSMGAGKTTLITHLCKQLGVVSEISSPSFSIVNEYTCASGDIVYHFDFYRIKDLEEVYDLGYEEYFDSGAICIIEWPEKIEELLTKEPHHLFKIDLHGDAREIHFVY